MTVKNDLTDIHCIANYSEKYQMLLSKISSNMFDHNYVFVSPVKKLECHLGPFASDSRNVRYAY